jgi:hypothetical protein
VVLSWHTSLDPVPSRKNCAGPDRLRNTNVFVAAVIELKEFSIWID